MKTHISQMPLMLIVMLISLFLLVPPVAVSAESNKAKSGEKAGKKKGKKKKNKKKADKKKADEKKETEATDTSDDKKAEPESASDSIFGDDDEKKETESADSTSDKASESGSIFDDGEKKEEEAAETSSEKEPEPAEQTDEGAAAKEDAEEGTPDAEADEVDMDIDEEEVVEEAEVESSDGILATEFDGEAAARRDRGVNIYTAHAARKGSLTLTFDHRPFKFLFSGEDAFFDYLGLDQGATLKVGIGLRYGIIDGLDFGIYRLNDGGTVPYDTYEFDLRYAFLNQDKHYINLMARAGVSWFAIEDAEDAVGFFGQLFIDRVFFGTLLVGAGFAFHSESSSPYKNASNDAYSGAVTGVLEWRALKWLAVTGEIAAPVLGYKQDYPGGTFALKILTHRHVFSLMLSNTQFINADGIVTGSWRSILEGEIIFGFQIYREFNIASY